MDSAGAFLRALLGRIGIALVVCVALVATGVVFVNRAIDHEIDRIPKVALTTSTTDHNGTNFLIIGSDSRQFVDSSTDPSAQAAFGTTADSGPPKSDTLMVLHADGANSYAVSFPRDTWVTIPGRGDMKINAAFNDGPQAVIDTLHQNFNIDINHYLEVGFETFSGLVDAVGGVPLYVPYPMRDTFTGLDVSGAFLNPCTILDGGQALAYVRSRHLEEYIDGKWRDASPLQDLDRIKRQQQFVKTLGRIAMDRAIADPTITPHLADKIVPNLTADAGFDRAAFDSLARSLLALRGSGEGLQFTTLPATGATRGGGQSVLLVDEAAAAPVLARLRGDVTATSTDAAASSTTTPGATAPTGVRPSDVRVSVHNGTQVNGAAGNALNAFVNLGFVAGSTDNAPKTARTEVRARAADAAKAQLVASYVPGADVVTDNSLAGDVVVVIGSNFSKVTAPSTTPPSGGSASSAAATTTTLSPQDACER